MAVNTWKSVGLWTQINLSNYTWAIEATGTLPTATNSGQILLFTEANVDAAFWSAINNGGGGLRVYEDALAVNQLPLHVVLCNTVTQKLIAFVRKPTYSSSDRKVFLFANNTDSQPPESSTYGQYAVYQDDIGFLHFEGEINSPNDVINEANGNTSSTSGNVTSTTGLFGNGWRTNAVTREYIGVRNTCNINPQSPFTISGWYNVQDISTYDPYLWSFNPIDDSERLALGIDESVGDKWKIFSSGETPGNASATAVISIWAKIDVVYDGVDLHLYVNGVFDYSVTPTGTGWQGQTAPDEFTLGAKYKRTNNTTLNEADCIYDLFETRQSQKTSSYIATEYANQSDPSTFWTMGASYDPSGSGSDVNITLSDSTVSDIITSVTTSKLATSVSQAVANNTISSYVDKFLSNSLVQNIADVIKTFSIDKLFTSSSQNAASITNFVNKLIGYDSNIIGTDRANTNNTKDVSNTSNISEINDVITALNKDVSNTSNISEINNVITALNKGINSTSAISEINDVINLVSKSSSYTSSITEINNIISSLEKTTLTSSSITEVDNITTSLQKIVNNLSTINAAGNVYTYTGLFSGSTSRVIGTPQFSTSISTIKRVPSAIAEALGLNTVLSIDKFTSNTVTNALSAEETILVEKALSSAISALGTVTTNISNIDGIISSVSATDNVTGTITKNIEIVATISTGSNTTQTINASISLSSSVSGTARVTTTTDNANAIRLVSKIVYAESTNLIMAIEAENTTGSIIITANN